MSDTTMNENPFEQPYAAGNSQPATADNSPPSRPQPPQIVIPPSAYTGGHHETHDSTSTSHSPTPESHSAATQSAKPTRRVQWPADLANHVSIEMASPTAKTLEDQGAQDELARALEKHSQEGGPFQSKYFPGSAPVSEAPSRAESVASEASEARLADVRDQMDVYVDPGETAGMPSVGAKDGLEGKSTKAAWNLVRGYAHGSNSFMRNRKNGGFKSGMGLNADQDKDKDEGGKHHQMKDEKEDIEEDDEKGGGGLWMRGRKKNQDDNVSATPDDLGYRTSAAGGVGGGGGILSALIALQAQQNAPASGPVSGATSVATTPTNSNPPSRRGSISEDSDDEAERIKFINKLRAKRQSKNAFHDVSGHLAGAGKMAGKTAVGLGGAVVGTAGHALGFGKPGHGHGRTTSSSSPPNTGTASTPGGLSAHDRSHSHTGLSSWMGSRSSTDLTRLPGQEGSGANSPRRRSVFGETVSSLKHLGGQMGLDVETANSRPQAAKSSAGVFGGLMLSTGNIAGVAAPSATKLAPQAHRPGYHLSRYSAPDQPPTRKSLSSRKSFDASTSRPGSVHSATSRPGSPLAEGDEEKGGVSPPLASPGATTGTKSAGQGAKHASKPSFLNIKDLPHTPKFSFNSRPPSLEGGSPRPSTMGDYFMGKEAHKETQEERERREWEKEKKRRRKAKDKRKQEEVFITMHVAAILARQEFIMKMARAFMMFGAPSHRLEAQMQATARVLEINCQVIYIPGVMLVSFGDIATHTSDIKFLKQANGLDLGKLLAAYYVYYKVIHDQISVTDASVALDELMVAPPKYKLWQNMIIGGLASAFIQPSAFYGSFIDCLASMPLGALLVLVQVIVSRNDLYSSLFEIVIACLNSFLAAALASTRQFCFSAVASGSVVLILPGYIVLCGALELANRSIISGSVRLVYSVLYSLFLGFGLAMGSEVYQKITGLPISGATDYTCATLRLNAPWYKATIPKWFYFLTVPMYLLMLGLRNGQPLFRKETPIMLCIGGAGFSANYFSGYAFPNRPDVTSAIGSFTVGVLGNLYGKFTRGSPFVVMVVGILFQLPSGLSNGGLLQFAAQSTTGSSETYSTGFQTAESLVEVAVGLTVGLFVSAALVNLFGGGRRRGSNLSSF